MPKPQSAPTTNFAHLGAHDEQLVRLGMLAERYFADDPSTALLKLRQLAELLAQLVAAKVGLYTSPEEAQYDLLRRLQDQSMLPREIAPHFGEVRRAGNAANHAIAGSRGSVPFSGGSFSRCSTPSTKLCGRRRPDPLTRTHEHRHA